MLRLLDDDVKPFRARAAAMIAEATGDLGDGSYREPAVEAVSEPEVNRCEACEVVNDLDATFCKKCGARMGAAEEAAETESVEE